MALRDSEDKCKKWINTLDKKELTKIRVAIRRSDKFSSSESSSTELDRNLGNPKDLVDVILYTEKKRKCKRNENREEFERNPIPLFNRTDIIVNQVEIDYHKQIKRARSRSGSFTYYEENLKRSRSPSSPRRRRPSSSERYRKRSRTPQTSRHSRSLSRERRDERYRRRSRTPSPLKRRRSRSKSHEYRRSKSKERKYVQNRSRTPSKDYKSYRRRSRSRSKERYARHKSPSPCSSRNRSRYSRSPRRSASPHRSGRPRSRGKSPTKPSEAKDAPNYIYPVPYFDGNTYWMPGPMPFGIPRPGPMPGPRFMPRPGFIPPPYGMPPRPRMPIPKRPILPPRPNLETKMQQNKNSIVVETSTGTIIEIPRDNNQQNKEKC